jgi:hypothetical protein
MNPRTTNGQIASHDIAIKLLPQDEADGGPLTAPQIRQIKKLLPRAKKRSVRSSLSRAKTA